MVRPDDRESRDAIEVLKAGLEELRADPPGEEEMMELIRDVKPAGPPRRLPYVGAAVAAVVLLAVGGTLLITGGWEPGLFAGGPQVAGAEQVEVRPPPLRVPRSESWGRGRKYRALLEVRGEETWLRLSYEPEDGGERVRRSSVLMPVAPRPKGAPEGTLVAVLLAAAAETPWKNVRAALSGPQGVLYLAGEEPGGTLGAIAAVVPRSFGERQAMQEIQRLGASVTPMDLVTGFPGEVFQLRITRGEGQTRYRYGAHPLAVPDAPRFGLGDVTLADARLAGGGGDPALTGLGEAMSGKKRSLVFLEAGAGVRYLDVLRALESAEGSWLLDMNTAGRSLEEILLPEPLDPADAAALTEDATGAPRAVVTVGQDGTAEPADPKFGGPGTEVWLRADRRAPFSACRAVLGRAIAAGRVTRIFFTPEEPGIHWERGVVVNLGSGTGKTVRMSPDDAVALAELDPGAGVVLAVPADATAGQVFPVLLRLVRLGAASIRFE